MRTRRVFVSAVVFLVFLSSTVIAQGIIIPDDRRPGPPEMIPLPRVKSQSVKVEIRDGAAVTTVDQVFFNDYSRPIEGTYIFPLPQGATVSEFAMWIGGQKVKGELLDREEAARIYRDIVRRMKDPALLELANYNLFKASIFPIDAHGEKRIELRYSETLKANGGLVDYTYPLKGRGKTYLTPIESFSLAVSIASGIPITSVYSPTHKVEVNRKDDRTASVGFEKTGFVPESDFQLYYTLSDKEFGLSLAVYNEAGIDQGYLMMLIAPRTEIEREQAAPKDVIFVLDTSGSMQDDDKIKQAVSTLKFGLKTLGERDRFGLISFATEVRPFREKLLPATEANVNAAISFLDGVSATGATNIYDSLHTALQMASGGDRPAYIVFLTDGLPTHVERDPAVIIKKAQEWAPKGVRVFTWGVGYDVDTRLLDSLSADHGGVSEYIKPAEEMELKLGQFFEKITFPVLTDLQLKIDGIEVSDLYPRVLPDLFRGSQLVLFGRFKGSGSATALLSGKVGEKSRSFTYTIDTREASGGDFIPQLWATRKVGFLLDEIRLHGEEKELKDEVIRLAKQYGLVTPYTSYLVTEPGFDRPDDLRPRPTADVVLRGEERRVMSEAPEQASGKKAVNYSQELRKMKEGELAGSGGELPIRRVADKTFNYSDGFWVDSEYEEGMRFIEITANSDEYFDLLSLDTRMAEWLSLGDKVVIVHGGVAYRIVPQQ
jgi:Ca-activated chloride channel family protein